MTDFLRDYGIYVLGGLVILFVIITFLLSRKPEKSREPERTTSIPSAEPASTPVEVAKAEPVEVAKAEPVVATPVEPEVQPTVVETQPAELEVAEAKKVEPVQKVVKPKAPKAEPVKSDEVDEDADEEAALKRVVKNPKYHISMNKDETSSYFKKWRVRKEGSTKTIKYFDTQKEAIEYAQGLAEKANTSVVIHKVDGSIRKQDYTKK